MRYEEFKMLLKWAQECGLHTVSGLKNFKAECTDGGKRELLAKMFCCYVYGVQLKEHEKGVRAC